MSVRNGSTTAMSVQFKKVGTANNAGVMLKDAIKLDNPIGKTKVGNSGDEIWIYESGDWTKYFFYSSRSKGNVWVQGGIEPADADDAITKETKATLKPGQCFFFVRGAGSDGVASLSGEVIPLKDVVSYEVRNGSTTAMAYPWPTEMPLNDFTKYVDNPIGKTKVGNSGDEIWVYESGDWTKYFFYSSRSKGNVWILGGIEPADADDAIAKKTTAKLLPGQAFFFVRGAGSDAVISFKKDAE